METLIEPEFGSWVRRRSTIFTPTESCDGIRVKVPSRGREQVENGTGPTHNASPYLTTSEAAEGGRFFTVQEIDDFRAVLRRFCAAVYRKVYRAGIGDNFLVL